MLSTCPSCLAQVNHADHLFDVTCECGAHFSPFLNVEDPKSSSFSEYAESSAAFQDIVSFGEKMSQDVDTPMEPVMQNTDSKEVTPPPMPPSLDFSEGLPKATASGKEIFLTTGVEFSGYAIEVHFSPVSLVTPFQPGQPNPLQVGFINLWKMAEAVGANGLIGVQTHITPDSQSVLLIGIPVRCSKVQ